MVEIYADCADLAQISKWAEDPRISGITTNPSLMKKAGISNYREFARQVLERVKDKAVSFEVLADEPEEMESQALALQALGENVFVKIPITYTDGIETIELIKRLWRQNVQVNVTAVMTREQLSYIGNAHGYGRRKTIVSIFAGRIADTTADPEMLFNYANVMYANKNVRYLWASTRELSNLVQAQRCAHIITMQPDLLGKLNLIRKDLAEYSLETVRQFHADGQGIVF